MNKPAKKLLLVGSISILAVVLIVVIVAGLSGSHSAYYSSSYSYSTDSASSAGTEPSDSTYATPPNTTESSGSTPAPSDLRVIQASAAVPLVLKSSTYCHALAPEDWVAQGTPRGDGMEVANPSNTAHVGWSMQGVDRGQEPYYGAASADPETHMLSVLNTYGLPAWGDSSGAQYTTSTGSMGGGYAFRRFESAQHTGMFIYRVYDAPLGLSPGSYTLSSRAVILDKSLSDQDAWIAFGVALSIGCTTQFMPSRWAGSSSYSSSRRSRDESDDLRDYNVQLGSQWAHSPSTGQNFFIDRATYYNDNGPDGPGYYRQVGNSYEKLEMGWSD